MIKDLMLMLMLRLMLITTPLPCSAPPQADALCLRAPPATSRSHPVDDCVDGSDGWWGEFTNV